MGDPERSRTMRGGRASRSAVSLLACILGLACQATGPATLPAADASRAEKVAVDPTEFSADRARRQMLRLAEFGSRAPGSRGSRRFREHLRGALGDLGIALREQRVSAIAGSGEEVELVHLTAVIPGRFADVLLLAAHYDTSEASGSPAGRDDRTASGPALLLELARTLHAGSVPEYTVWLTWIDGDTLGSTAAAPIQARSGTQSLVDAWSREGTFSRIRAAIFFGEVGDSERPIVRDVDSPRIYREIFWEVARELGYGELFPEDSRYGLVSTGRATFAQAQLRSSVALANQRAAEDETPDRLGGARLAPSVPVRSTGFEAVGNVTLQVLTRIAEKLRKIDRFAQSPLTAGRGEVPGNARVD